MSEVISQGLTLTLPSLGQSNWVSIVKNNFAANISSHDHTGGGKGLQLGSNSILPGSILGTHLAASAILPQHILDNSISGAKMLLNNMEAFRAWSFDGHDRVDLFRLNESDQLEFLVPFGLPYNTFDDTGFRVRNAQYIRGRNFLDTGDVNLIGINAANEIAFGTSARIGNNTGINFAGNVGATGGQILSTNETYSADSFAVQTTGNFFIRAGGIDPTLISDEPWTFSATAMLAAGDGLASIGSSTRKIGNIYAINLLGNGAASTIGTLSNHDLNFQRNSTNILKLTAAGLLVFTDDTYDLGAVGGGYKSVHCRNTYLKISDLGQDPTAVASGGYLYVANDGSLRYRKPTGLGGGPEVIIVEAGTTTITQL